MRRILLSALALIMVLSLAACGGQDTKAAAMHLRRAEGTVAVSDGGGRDVPVRDNLGLYGGYGVNTRSVSYAWIDLDDVKLTKLDQNSEIFIGQEGKSLDIELRSGSLFFNITEPLAEDETMNIRTSTMLVGIRGTCGWVEERGGLSRVYLLEGKVECSAGEQTVQVNAGEFAELTADGKLVVKEFTEQDIPAFVREEVDSGADETPEPVNSVAPEPADTPDASDNTPAPETTPGPDSGPTAGPTAGSTPGPASGPSQAPTSQPVPAPESEPVSTPAPAPTPEPTAEPGGNIPERRFRRINGYSPEGVLLYYDEFEYDESGRTSRQISYSPEGIPEWYYIGHYDELGREIRWEIYRADGEMESYIEEIYDEQNRRVSSQYYDADGTPTGYDTFVHNEGGQMAESHFYHYFDGTEYHSFTVYLYNERGLLIKEEYHDQDGRLSGYMAYEYDGAGFMTKATNYDQDGTIMEYSLFEYS